NVTFDNDDPRALRQIREFLPRDRTGARQFKQRSPQVRVTPQDRNEERAGAAGHVENLAVASEVVICRQRRRAWTGDGFHASRENLLLALIELAELRLAIAGSHRVGELLPRRITDLIEEAQHRSQIGTRLAGEKGCRRLAVFI